MEVKLERGYIQVGSRKASLLSGTVHYWRLHPECWRQILQSIKDMGLETIETYVCWEFHEIEKDIFDFSGKTDSRRDLAGFLELVKEMGLWIILRPGPFIYSEWMHMGVPQDVAQYHRMHPKFTRRAATYIREVCQVIAPYQATRGGNFIMLQPDNETDSFEYCYEEQLGLGHEPGEFQQFLKEKYQDIDLLNRRWNTRLDSFDKARATMSSIDIEPAYFKRYQDFMEFRADYINRCVKFYRDEYRKNGIDVPQYTNLYDNFTVQDALALRDIVDLVGMDAYPANEFRTNTFVSSDDRGHRRTGEYFRYLRTFSETAYLAEYEAGIAHGLHYFTGVVWPNHYFMTNLTAIQSGMHAWNWFMIVNHDNWMMCPINEWGRKQGEIFRVFKEVVDLYKSIDVPSLEKLTNTSLFFYLQHQVNKASDFDPASLALYDAGVDYELYNMETGQVRKPVLFYSGENWLPKALQEDLIHYVEEGGNLVFFQTLPLFDEKGKEINLLGLVKPDRIPNEPFLSHLATQTEIDLDGEKARTRAPFFVYDNPTPGKPIYGERVDGNIPNTDFEENIYLRSLVIGHRYQVGYHEKRGKGSITVLGVRPTPDFVTIIHKYIKIKIPILADSNVVKTALFHGKDAYYAVLINTGEYPVDASLDIDQSLITDGNYSAVSLRSQFDMDDRQIHRGRFYVSLPRKDGTIIKIKKK